MPKLTAIRRPRSRKNPRRRNSRRAEPKFQVVRGSKRNQVVIALESSAGAAKRLARWFRHHSGNRTVRVEKFAPSEDKR